MDEFRTIGLSLWKIEVRRGMVMIEVSTQAGLYTLWMKVDWDQEDLEQLGVKEVSLQVEDTNFQ